MRACCCCWYCWHRCGVRVAVSNVPRLSSLTRTQKNRSEYEKEAKRVTCWRYAICDRRYSCRAFYNIVHTKGKSRFITAISSLCARALTSFCIHIAVTSLPLPRRVPRSRSVVGGSHSCGRKINATSEP